MLMMSHTALKSVSFSAQSSSSLLLRRAGRKIAARSRKSTTFYKTGKAFASSESEGKEEEEEWAAMGSNAKSNVVPRKPTQLAGTNAPEYMHGVLAFNRFYPENARGDTFNRHLLVALVSFFFVLDTFLFALFFSWTSTKTTMQSSAIMEKNIVMILVVIWLRFCL